MKTIVTITLFRFFVTLVPSISAFFPIGAFAGVSYAELKTGKTAYELAGNSESPLVILIHGVSGPMTVWDAIYDPLVRAGFKVLRYDLLGRGFSDRVQSRYDQKLFQNQLNELLELLELSHQEMILVGSSLGNIIGSDFAKKNSSLVRSMIMIGPAGFKTNGGLLQRLSTTPIVGDLLLRAVGKQTILKRNKEYFYDPTRFRQFLTNYETQLEVPGSKEAILSTMRHMPVVDYSEGFEELGKLKIPTLIFWGQQDVSFEFKFSEHLLKALPHARLVPVADAAHLPQLERPDSILPELLNFLRAK